MKKILMICALCLTIATHAYAEGCAGGHGTVVVGNDGKSYCASKIVMNWWSANAWCVANGMKLIDTNKHCACTGNEKCNEAVSCPNFYKVGSNVWTATPNGSSNAYVVSLNSGNFIHGNLSRNYSGYFALCAQP